MYLLFKCCERSKHTCGLHSCSCSFFPGLYYLLVSLISRRWPTCDGDFQLCPPSQTQAPLFTSSCRAIQKLPLWILLFHPTKINSLWEWMNQTPPCTKLSPPPFFSHPYIACALWCFLKGVSSSFCSLSSSSTSFSLFDPGLFFCHPCGGVLSHYLADVLLIHLKISLSESGLGNCLESCSQPFQCKFTVNNWNLLYFGLWFIASSWFWNHDWHLH